MPAFLEEFHRTMEKDEKCPKVEMECARKMPTESPNFSPQPFREHNLRKASNDSHEPTQLVLRHYLIVCNSVQ